ncbi:HpcH/HpaI aldolase/citrate lyase family protein [Acuticoccus mangrovi]|uniref:CoA ester lyase n=1 Tax=Acuticoccus mangrovi TaxID=2796142 RepID=A0A934ISD3_9HYPH|nr:CoA ester lyase [Acuticoccus mangrovi]MBJ3776784.1 CoA ester lyase [Acuticoccus mangrovi]
MRSLLFVPGDSERKLAKAFDSGADVVILDLEDAVDISRKAVARAMVRDVLPDAPATIAVRVNSFASGLLEDDLSAVMPGRPAYIMLPKSESGADVTHLSQLLSVEEAHADTIEGSTKIIAIATETASALFGLGTYRGASSRLAAMTWGSEDLSTSLGAARSRDADGVLTGPFQTARTLCLAGAVSAGVTPIDSVWVDFRDDAGLKAEADAAALDGFLGKLAIHPAQVPVINEAFTPTAEALAHARRIVDAFASNPGAGVVSIDGKMVDKPHLTLAERLLARAG